MIGGSHGAHGPGRGCGGRVGEVVCSLATHPRAATGAYQLAGGVLSACAAERRCGPGSVARAGPATLKFVLTFWPHSYVFIGFVGEQGPS